MCTNGLGRTTNPAEPGTKRFIRIAAPNSFYLQVDGVPNKLHGTPYPLGYGSHLDITNGTVITNNVTSPTDQTGGVRYACVKWVLKKDNGDFVSELVSTQAVFTLTTNMVLAWHWTNEYLLTVNASSNGTVNSATVNGWYTNGTVVANIQAFPSNSYVFSLWTGDVPASNATDNPLSIAMTQPRTIQAHFIPAVSITKLWNGNGIWTNGGNWSPAGAPSPLDHAILQSGVCVLKQSAYVRSLVISNGATLMFTNWTTKLYVTEDVIIRSGGVMTLPSSFTEAQMSNRVYFSCSNLFIEKTGSINVDGKGYYPWNEPGKGNTCNYGHGAGYGGRGGRAFPENPYEVGIVYGSPSAPLAPGSGGGSYPQTDWQARAGSGGGAVRVEASGTVIVDGTISANGGNAIVGQHAAGGSGGAR
mgnify:CR=1 FL=1